MANYFTHLAFQIPATSDDAERFNEAIAAASVAGNSGAADDDELAGVACRFDQDSATLAIFDTDGAPNLWALAKTLQRLFPEKLPLGFAYSCSCDKPRSDGFGGGPRPACYHPRDIDNRIIRVVLNVPCRPTQPRWRGWGE